tara:strand:+ start:150 stop:272 length:123 start_codon:yes stop_codon:yes gene_type:complete
MKVGRRTLSSLAGESCMGYQAMDIPEYRYLYLSSMSANFN